METGPDPVDMMIGFSHFEGGRAATNHLIEVGYRQIGFLGARMDPRSQRRLAGYRAAMEAAGLFDPRLVTTTPVPSSVSLGRDLFRDALAKMPTLDAVFCNNDDLALGVLFECHRASIEVPQTIGIAGFNDLDMMQVAFPVDHQRPDAIATRSAARRWSWRVQAIAGEIARRTVSSTSASS